MTADSISYPLENREKENVRLLLDAFGEIWPDSNYGPLHILIADYNALDSHLSYCRGLTRGMLHNYGMQYEATQGEIDKVKDYDLHLESELQASLLLLDILALIPEDQRDIHDAKGDYED